MSWFPTKDTRPARPYPKDAALDWESLRQRADLTIPEIKAKLPLTYVLHRAGRPVNEAGAALCPFHDDTNPSLQVYGELQDRWKCHPCGAGGDVLDFLQRFGSEDVGAAVLRARSLLAEMTETGWTPPPVSPARPALDIEAAEALVEASEDEDPAPVYELIEKKGWSFSPEWLMQEWGVSAIKGAVLIPYYDRQGRLVAYKTRYPDGPTKAATGSKFSDVLYGAWRDTGLKPVLLCEGESDAWASSHELPDFDVLALPAGAGALPHQAPQLAGRTVYLAFDGDEAGRAALHRWHEALREHSDVFVVPLPDGEDMASYGPRKAVQRARQIVRVPTTLHAEGFAYVRNTKDTQVPVSNWTFAPIRELTGDEGTAYEGILYPHRQKVILGSKDLASKTAVVRWSNRHGCVWYGTERDAQALLGMLQQEGAFLSQGRMVSVAGLHAGHFVWPGGRIGPEDWTYVPPAADLHLEDKINIEPGDWSASQILALRELHLPEIVDPILAWLAVAPLRALLREFPILSVSGASGTGKTTLIETVVAALSGTSISLNLTSTTAHALFAAVGSTNAFPVWFDEYRPGARKDTLERFEQIIRDAYVGQASAKGGLGDRWAEIQFVPATAPIIVTGEDSFSETSHVERMVLVHLPPDGRNPEALKRVQKWERTGLPWAYLSWLRSGIDYTTGKLNLAPDGPEHLSPRQRHNLGVLRFGWNLLWGFCAEHDVNIGEPDWSLVVSEATREHESNPIKDALIWALDEPDAAGFLYEEDGRVYVRPINFVRFIEDKTSIPLPGRSKAVIRYLETHLRAERTTTKRWGGQKRSLVFDRTFLD